jgi:hypothetical protein
MAKFQTEVHSDAEELQHSEMYVWRLLNAKITIIKKTLAKSRSDDVEGGKMLEALREFEQQKDHPKVRELARKTEHHPSDLSKEQRRALDADISGLLPVGVVPGGDGSPVRVQWQISSETARPLPPEEAVDSTPPDPIPQIEVPPLVANGSPVSERPKKLGVAQDEAILKAIRDAGYDPMQVPKNEHGKPGVKAAVRTALVGVNANFPKAGRQFDKAWERLRENGELADKP